ncbi:hypothetical protein V2J09_020999 [Rumex salicifolius]
MDENRQNQYPSSSNQVPWMSSYARASVRGVVDVKLRQSFYRSRCPRCLATSEVVVVDPQTWMRVTSCI